MTIKHEGAPKHWLNKPHVEDHKNCERFITVLKAVYPDIDDFGINQAIKALRLYLAGTVPTPTVYDATQRMAAKNLRRYGPTITTHCVVATIYEWMCSQEDSAHDNIS